MTALDLHPRRTIRFVAWMDEELGSPGAQAYVQDPANKTLDHVAVMETDRGADRSYGIGFSGSPKLQSYLAPVADALDPIGANLATPDDEIGEDVSGLIAQGAVGLMPNQDLRTYFRYHHTAADTLDKIDPAQLAQTAAVNAVTAFALADAPERPPK
jgi:Zn-dependent M28 family amino/carboxypeptidase